MRWYLFHTICKISPKVQCLQIFHGKKNTKNKAAVFTAPWFAMSLFYRLIIFLFSFNIRWCAIFLSSTFYRICNDEFFLSTFYHWNFVYGYRYLTFLSPVTFTVFFSSLNVWKFVSPIRFVIVFFFLQKSYWLFSAV